MKIVIDAGHGKNTPGKRTPDDSMREWEFNNEVALIAGPLLESYKGVSVKYTHDTTGKTDVPLTTRTNEANKWGADIFVSIHANAAGSGWSSAHGIETFVYTSIKAGSETYKLAENVQAALIKETGLSNRGVKRADLHMIRETNMPAILCECGFMTNRDEAKLLKSSAYRKKVAQAIVDGIVKSYGLKKEAKASDSKPSTAKPSATSTHKVVKGDTLWGIATDNGMTVAELKALNKGVKLDPLQIGTVLKLSGSKSSTHTVKRGDTLWGIATDNQMTVAELKALNKGKDLEPLQIGELLRLK